MVTQRRDNGHWEAPGGVLELGESIEDGLVREVAEETGLTVEIERLTGVYKNMARGIIGLVFRAHAVSGTAQPTDEVGRVEWLSPDQVRQLMDEAYAVRVLDALTPGDVKVRAHDGVRLVAMPDQR
jgi:ADP-ribose pyrophosphatase YjhB (NUDIX family)